LKMSLKLLVDQLLCFGAERNRIVSSCSNTKTEVPAEVKRMRYLEAEGPKKKDFLISKINSAEGEKSNSSVDRKSTFKDTV
jgi:hypothetical protein